MTDVLTSVLIPYAQFLEARARRLGIATQLTPPDGQRTKVAVSSATIASDESSVRALATAEHD